MTKLTKTPEQWAEWKENLQPLKKFVDYNVKNWVPATEYIINKTTLGRIKIVIERPHEDDPSRMYAFDMGRIEYLNKQGIDIDKLDTEEFSKELMATLFMETSINEMEAIIAELQKYVSDFYSQWAEVESKLPD